MTEQATEKQIKFAKHLGIQNPETFSKQTLREIIDNALGGAKKEEVPVVRPGEAPKTQPEAPEREFHLSPEQVNTNALNCAINVHVNAKVAYSPEQIIDMAKIFKEYIENGN